MKKLTKNDILNSEAVKSFLENHPKQKTKAAYSSNIVKFFLFLDIHPDEYIKDIRLLEKNERLKQTDFYEKTIKKYWHHCMKEYAPLSINVKMNTIKSFLIDHRIDLDKVFWKTIRSNSKGNAAATIDKVPTPQELKKILSYANPKAKALFLCISSSGMRREEATLLEPRDIPAFNEIKEGTYPKGEPAEITLRAEITKNSRNCYTFISCEAVDALHSWLQVREKYIQTKDERCPRSNFKHIKDENVNLERYHKHIFPFSTQTANDAFNRCLKKSGFDEKDETTERYKIHIHSLRKYAKINFTENKEVMDALMNHTQNLDKIYASFSKEQIKEIYRKGQNGLLVFERPIDESSLIAELQDKLKEQDKRIREIKEERNDYLKQLEPFIIKAMELHYQKYGDSDEHNIIYPEKLINEELNKK